MFHIHHHTFLQKNCSTALFAIKIVFLFLQILSKCDAVHSIIDIDWQQPNDTLHIQVSNSLSIEPSAHSFCIVPGYLLFRQSMAICWGVWEGSPQMQPGSPHLSSQYWIQLWLVLMQLRAVHSLVLRSNSGGRSVGSHIMCMTSEFIATYSSVRASVELKCSSVSC